MPAMVLMTTFAANVIVSPILTVLIDERDPPLYGSLHAFRLYVAKILQSPVINLVYGPLDNKLLWKKVYKLV